MQTVSQKIGRTAGAARPASRRSAVVVRASAEESRRAVLGALFSTVVLSSSSSSSALTPVDLIDDRPAKQKGFDIIYEARDLSLPQNTRDGFTQARTDLASTKSRVKESENRLDRGVEPYIQKSYWTLAREELRNQVGTLRFDLQTLASLKPKDDKKKVLALRKEFIAKVEDLDFSLRQKDKESSLKKLVSAKSALDAVLAVVL